MKKGTMTSNSWCLLIFLFTIKLSATMKITTALLLLSLGLSLQACRNPDVVADDRAAIKSISFAGVPPQNVTIDRARSTITIQLPTDLRGGLKPVLELNEGASVVGGLTADGFVDLTPQCYCGIKDRQSSIVVDTEISSSSFKHRRSYIVRITNQGPLKALDSDIPLTFSRKTKELFLRLPVENLYTNPIITQVRFTNIVTGTTHIAGFDAVCLNTCDSRFTNQLIFRLTTPIEYTLTPGTYKISAGGVEFPQKLVVTE